MGAAANLPRLYCDFNERDEEADCWLLFKDGARLGPSLEAHSLREGDRVILYQDEGDFEVEATLNWGQTPYGEVAVPDWSTRRDLA